MGEILNQAIIFASNAHKDQVRKGTETPYILHPLETTAIAGTITTNEKILAAAVLHDVIEDTETSFETLKNIFGEEIADYVNAVSENKRNNLSPETTWKIRKTETLSILKDAPFEVKIIVLGDKLSNMRSIYRDYILIGDKLWQRFNQNNKAEHYWYYNSIAQNLSQLKNYPAYNEYLYLINEVFCK